MGDHVTEVQLANQFANLDAALARNDRLAASLATDQINNLTLRLRPRPKARENKMVQNLPRWMRGIVRNRGIRVPALENAFGVNKVVLTGSLGTRKMLMLKINF